MIYTNISVDVLVSNPILAPYSVPVIFLQPNQQGAQDSIKVEAQYVKAQAEELKLRPSMQGPNNLFKMN